MQKIFRHGRYQLTREEKRPCYRKHDRHRHGYEQKARNPSRKNMGTKTMQMHSRETNAGVAICVAPSMIAVSISLPSSDEG